MWLCTIDFLFYHQSTIIIIWFCILVMSLTWFYMPGSPLFSLKRSGSLWMELHSYDIWTSLLVVWLTWFGLSMVYCFGEILTIAVQLFVSDWAAGIHLEVFEYWHWFLLEHLFSSTHQPHRGLTLPRQLEQSIQDEQLATGISKTFVWYHLHVSNLNASSSNSPLC